jgi:hypothetical protein
MTWTPVTQDDILTVQRIVLWIKTARAAGYGGPEWLPSPSDVSKSALYERIRSGKLPLEYPPPRALSCPWYAVVEDPGPHYVGSGNYAPVFSKEPFFGAQIPFQDVKIDDLVLIFQNEWRVESLHGVDGSVVEEDADYVTVKDAHHCETPYRFHLWYDPKWVVPHAPDQKPGGWFIKNADLVSKDQSVA